MVVRGSCHTVRPGLALTCWRVRIDRQRNPNFVASSRKARQKRSEIDAILQIWWKRGIGQVTVSFEIDINSVVAVFLSIVDKHTNEGVGDRVIILVDQQIITTKN